MMRRFALVLVLVMAVLPALVPAQEPPKPAVVKSVPQYLQDTSATVRSLRGSGSGTFKVTKDGGVWILTCAHVVEGNRTQREAIVGGAKKTIVEFVDMQILITRIKDGRKVGETILDAEVVRYSDAENGHDLALLRIRDDDYKPKASLKFYLDKELPPIGVELYHCGSLLGNFGAQSITFGIMSQHGRILFGQPFDQAQCTAFPGSSGGAVVMKEDGRYVGMVVRGAGEGFNLIVPVRRIVHWSKQTGIDFILDDTKPVPSMDDLRKVPIDDTDAVRKDANKTDRSFPCLFSWDRPSNLLEVEQIEHMPRLLP